MYSVNKTINGAQPVVVATNKPKSEAMAIAAQLALQSAGTMAVSRSTPQQSHYHRITVGIAFGSSVDMLCSNSTHPPVQLKWAPQEADGRR